LVTAVASYLEARAAGGEWLLRIEDVDGPRSIAGADRLILDTLKLYGFHWDGPVVRQSQRLDAYESALAQLKTAGVIYPCGCSRKEVGAIYPGTCRDGLRPGKEPRAWRLRVPDEEIAFEDQRSGRFVQNLQHGVGDFVLLRADGVFAYQLAVVVDDAWQGITDIVRGADMLDSTPRQIYLQRLLGYPQPRYTHIPLVLDKHGEKLSKQKGAQALSLQDPVKELRRALEFLGSKPPAEIDNLTDLWKWATAIRS
jgi:glutamyl-Q tRNA(Asp) synthetase